MVKLYKKQAEIVDQLESIFGQGYNYYRQNGLYLSGEMGVGKTYIASKLAIDFLKKYPNKFVIVVTPAQVTKKFKNVIEDFNGNDDIKAEIWGAKTVLNTNSIYVISHNMFNRFSNSLEGNNLTNLGLMIYDEVHKLTASQLKSLDSLIKNDDLKGLYMTGTIFDVNIGDLCRILNTTHQHLIKRAFGVNDAFEASTDKAYEYRKFSTFREAYTNDIFSFVSDIWQYISLSLSLDDVKKQAETDIVQEIAPVKYIDYTMEQKLFVNLITAQMNKLNFSILKRDEMVSDFLDEPTLSLTKKHKTKFSKNYLNSEALSIIGVGLKDVKLVDTPKFKRLTSILESNEGKKVLVYVRSLNLIKELEQELTTLGYKAKGITNYSSPEDLSDKIKGYYETGTKIILINSKKVETGVDIYADILVWYQLISSVSGIIQAQRRIYRLNSESSTTVYFLAYNHSFQQSLVEQVSNASKYNAATYGTNLKDSLTKITGYVLDTDDLEDSEGEQ